MTPKLSPAEALKANSRRLRGTLAEEVTSEAEEFSKDAATLLKFHGAYQQIDRDVRKLENRKVHRVMVRVSVPGGAVTAKQYLALDRLADTAGDGTLRITSRGGLQYHYIGKRGLRTLIRAINEAGLSTLAACGDVVRNVVAPAELIEDGERAPLLPYALELNRELKPRTGAYAEIWLDGEKAASFEPPEESEPLYGETYLPRKFKFGFAYAGDNTTDIYSHDIGLVAHCRGGAVSRFTVLAGGGMGRTNGVEASFPRIADVIGDIEPRELLAMARAAVSIHRDFGNRANRKAARLRYVLAERGAEWFRLELETRLGRPLAAPSGLNWTRHADYLGWHEQGNGLWFFGLRILSGRVAGGARAAAAEIAAKLQPELRFTVQQNVLFTGLRAEQKAEFEAILARHGVPLPDALPPVLRYSMACVALPTCGLALAEGERALPGVVEEVQALFDAAGVGDAPVHLRMTGCPNGCARPYSAEIGIVGQSPDLYSLYLGGSPLSTRIAPLYSHNIKRADIAATLRPIVERYARERQSGEAFGDFCFRVGIKAGAAPEEVAAAR